jgi:hypothetical protein
MNQLTLVIPAKAGIHGAAFAKVRIFAQVERWIPAFAGMTV